MGRGQGFCDDITQALVMKSVTGIGDKKCKNYVMPFMDDTSSATSLPLT